MQKKRNMTCRIFRCEDDLYLGGFCKNHYEEDVLRTRRRQAAIDVLHYREFDGTQPQAPHLQAELKRIRAWWSDACSAVNYQKSFGKIPFDEAEAALEWCISIAQEIVAEELQFRLNGRPLQNPLPSKEWVWERFINLEKGLRSNGIERTK